MGNFMSALVRIFFRQVDVVGAFRVPDSGPVIFVANHSNQFVDPLMLTSCTNRPVRFLCAAKSMRRPMVGRLAKAAQAISVERPQDLARKGKGTVSVEAGGTELTGKGTSFCAELQPGCKVKAGELELTVKAVESDSRCKVAAAEAAVADASFKVHPKVDQGDTFTEVHKALKDGDCIGIFPEGGSHDQTGLLELKPGVAIMALGAMVEGSAPVQIVPCGMTYFEPHRFRSRAIVEFGAPITVPAALAERYRTDKRGAVGELMSQVEDSLNAVVPNASNYKEMQAIITMKALYKPRDRKLTPEESLRLTKNFTSAAQNEGFKAKMQEALNKVEDYNSMLKASGMKDRDVRRSAAGRNFTPRALGALLQALILMPLVLPAMILFAPVGLLTLMLAEKERKKALAGSSVKVKAIDVVASYKILVALVIVPLYNLLLTALIIWLCGLAFWWLPLVYVLIYPAQYLLILASDHFVRCVKHCTAIMLFGCKRSDTARLQEKREELQVMVKSMVEELGPQIHEDFEKVRVIKQREHFELEKGLQEPLTNAIEFGGIGDLLKPGGAQGQEDPLLAAE